MMVIPSGKHTAIENCPVEIVDLPIFIAWFSIVFCIPLPGRVDGNAGLLRGRESARHRITGSVTHGAALGTSQSSYGGFQK